ncbi:MAG: crossover junction endodeoxyribonuclease RuvC [Syntrophaceae bacterium]|nr:crossover junction endodeoxyribonuclease RuvC [Syntrophaceae bacterium]
MKILGIDPGFHVTGYGLIEKIKGKPVHVLHGEIKLPRNEILSGGLTRIYGKLIEIIREQQPQALAVEDIFYGKNIKSLIKQAHVRGVTILAGSEQGVPVFEYTPLEVKSAVVGYGRAEKFQVQKMIQAILNLPAPLPADASDALAVAVCHMNFQKETPV